MCIVTSSGDTSQHGDWMGFRNVLFDNKHFTITKAFTDAALPEKGRIEFDFVSFEQISIKEGTISNLRLFRILYR